MTSNCWIELVSLSSTKVDASYLYLPHASVISDIGAPVTRI